MYLREMENQISRSVFARNHIEPQLPHEEHGVGRVDGRSHWRQTRTQTFPLVNTGPKSIERRHYSTMFTVFDPRHFLGPVGYLSQAIKEVVCFIQTENLRGASITGTRMLIAIEMLHICYTMV